MTGLRGAAALFVVCYHFSTLKPDSRAISAQNVLAHGYIAVDLFFVISGFVIALNCADEFKLTTRWDAILSFLRRRIARIYPLYLWICIVNVAVIFLLVPWLIPHDFPVILIANVTLVQSWFAVMSLEPPMWSISAEWAAYLGFPLLVRVALGSRRHALWTFVGCVAILSALVLLPSWSDPANERDRSPLNLVHVPSAVLARCVAEFTLGLLAYRFYKSPLSHRLSSGGGWSTVLAGLVCLLLPFRSSDLALVLLFAPLVVSISRDRGPIAWLLSSRVPFFLGTCSYAIYLVAPVIQRTIVPTCMEFFERSGSETLATSLAGAVCFPLLLVLSYLAHRYVEIPGRVALSPARSHSLSRGPLVRAETSTPI